MDKIAPFGNVFASLNHLHYRAIKLNFMRIKKETKEIIFYGMNN